MIIGAGFGGINAAVGLKKADVDVTVIDRRNYHLFQPLLYQVATAGLSPAQIAMPIRHILRRQKNATVLMDIDKDARLVITGSRRVPYDCLVVTTGARHAYFGHDEARCQHLLASTGVRMFGSRRSGFPARSSPKPSAPLYLSRSE